MIRIGPRAFIGKTELKNLLIFKRQISFPGTFLTFMGRDALSLAITGLGLKSQDKVLLPAYLCPEVLDPFLGRTRVRFYDLRPDLTIDPEEIKSRIVSEEVRLVAAINYFGFLQPHLKRIKALCAKRGVLLLEDCAHAFLTEGAGDTGDLVLFSFRKLLPVTDGGGLKVSPGIRITPSFYPRLISDLFASAVILKSQFRLTSEGLSRRGLVSRLGRFLPGSSFSRMPARVLPMSHFSNNGIANSNFAEIVQKRRDNFFAWRELAKKTGCFRPLFVDLPDQVCPLGFPVRMKDKKRVLKRLRERGICLKIHWPLPPQVGEEFVNSHRISAEEATLPVHTGLGPGEIERIHRIISMGR